MIFYTPTPRGSDLSSTNLILTSSSFVGREQCSNGNSLLMGLRRRPFPVLFTTTSSAPRTLPSLPRNNFETLPLLHSLRLTFFSPIKKSHQKSIHRIFLISGQL